MNGKNIHISLEVDIPPEGIESIKEVVGQVDTVLSRVERIIPLLDSKPIQILSKLFGGKTEKKSDE